MEMLCSRTKMTTALGVRVETSRMGFIVIIKTVVIIITIISTIKIINRISKGNHKDSIRMGIIKEMEGRQLITRRVEEVMGMEMGFSKIEAGTIIIITIMGVEEAAGIINMEGTTEEDTRITIMGADIIMEVVVDIIMVVTGAVTRKITIKTGQSQAKKMTLSKSTMETEDTTVTPTITTEVVATTTTTTAVATRKGTVVITTKTISIVSQTTPTSSKKPFTTSLRITPTGTASTKISTKALRKSISGQRLKTIK